MKSADIPCILLVEDDPVALAFLTAAAESAGVRVDGASSVAQALARDDRHTHAAWLIDANLPDGRGDALLGTLRQRHPRTPALAHTASHLRADLDALLHAGFDEVLVKPLPAQAVADAIRRVLGLTPENAAVRFDGIAPQVKLPIWDDEAAARAMAGNLDHVTALRDLFLAELPQTRTLIAEAGRNAQAGIVLDELHKLRASCGFVGAARLASAAATLRAAATDPDALAHFDHVVEDTLATQPSQRSASSPSVAHG